MAKLPELSVTSWNANANAMQSDIDPEKIQDGSLYLTVPESGALNIRSTGAGTNQSPDYSLIIGNARAYAPDSAVVQNKIFRIYVDSSEEHYYFVTLTDPNINSVLVNSFFGYVLIIPVAPVNVGNIAAVLTNAITTVLPATIAPGQIYNATSVVTGTNTGYIDLEITTVAGWDYIMAGRIVIPNPLYINPDVTIIQEAIDASMVGEWHEIGDDDRTGDLFHQWTTRTTIPEILNVTTGDNGLGVYRVTTPTPHGWSDGFSVEIKNTGTTADGIWIIDVITATTFDLLSSVYAANGSGTATSYLYGLGEIGVAVKDENLQTWTYTRLLRSREYNFTTVYQIDSRVKRKNDERKADYFTDDYNPPRVFYYKGAYIPDGALVINGGQYEYGTINEELKLQVTTAGFRIDFVNQIQQGGNILSGNTRYSARFLTDKLSPSEWTYLTNPVPAAKSDEAGSGYTFFGNDSGVATPKQNVLSVTVPIQGLFKYVEIAAINYLDGGFTGAIIGRYLLEGSVLQYITHTGFESNLTDLDIGTLNAIENIYKTAQNIELSQNRVILSNLTIDTIQVDLSAWFETWTYELHRTADASIKSTGSYINGFLQTGEYQLSGNVYNKASYMLNERYRFGAVVTWKTGGRSPVFYIDDVEFNTTPDARKIVALPNYNLTNNSAFLNFPSPYAFYITWTGYDLDAIVNGKSVRDWIADIEIVRCEVVNPQVIASGYISPSVNAFVSQGVTQATWVDPNNVANGNKYGEFPWVCGIDEAALPLAVDYLYGTTPNANDFGYVVDYCSFYNADSYLGGEPISPQNGDIILNYGQPNFIRNKLTTTNFGIYIGEFDGVTGTVTPDQFLVSEGYVLKKGESVTFTTTAFFSKKLRTINGIPVLGTYYFDAMDSVVLYSATTSLSPITANPDVAFYIAQYYRPKTELAQYGDPANSKYVTTGSHLKITDSSPTTFNTFGGDCFTQRTWLKNRYPTELVPEGFGQGVGYYAQNRINFQMRQTNTTLAAFPASATLQDWLDPVEVETLLYNHGYDIRNEIVLYAAFDVNSISDYQFDWGNAFAWSAEESDGTTSDNLRQFPPLNIVFEDYTDGEITELKDFKGNILVMQPRNTHIRLYNPSNLITSSEGSQVIMGVDANVFSQKPVPVSNFGCSNKWSVGEGLSDKGQKIIYYWDLINKAVVRVGYDGNNSLDEIKGIKSFIANNTQYLIGKDSPKNNEGISVVPNQRYREIIWTCRGFKAGLPPWTNAGFSVGNVVSYGTLNFDTIPQFYQLALADDTPATPPPDNTNWVAIQRTDNRYYNVYTLVWDELKNQFQAFHTYTPKVLVKYRNTFLSARNISDTGVMYEHDKGALCVWYDDGVTKLESDGYFEGVINQYDDVVKYFMATVYQSDIPPSRVDLQTKSKQSYLVQGDFKTQEYAHFSTIKNDSTVSVANPTGINTARTSRLYGHYMIVRSWMSRLEFNRIKSFMIKWRKSERTPFS